MSEAPKLLVSQDRRAVTFEGLGSGEYEVRLFGDNGHDRLMTSTSMIVSEPEPELEPEPNRARAGTRARARPRNQSLSPK